MPLDEPSDAERALTIGLALGWIAMRGNSYYANLTRNPDSGRPEFVVPLKSQWEGLAFTGGEFLPRGDVLDKAVESGRFLYKQRDEIETRNRLGDNFDHALPTIHRDAKLTRTVYEAYQRLGEITSASAMASDLEKRLALMADTLAAVDDNRREMLMRQSAVLRFEIDKLKSS